MEEDGDAGELLPEAVDGLTHDDAQLPRRDHEAVARGLLVGGAVPHVLEAVVDRVEVLHVLVRLVLDALLRGRRAKTRHALEDAVGAEDDSRGRRPWRRGEPTLEAARPRAEAHEPPAGEHRRLGFRCLEAADHLVRGEGPVGAQQLLGGPLLPRRHGDEVALARSARGLARPREHRLARGPGRHRHGEAPQPRGGVLLDGLRDRGPHEPLDNLPPVELLDLVQHLLHNRADVAPRLVETKRCLQHGCADSLACALKNSLHCLQPSRNTL
mmetsp:Transcript_38430/g.91156  ORF Transcript_38430/g.91156 Transcript_38430/m.91156 type:complete len:270 (+) Transcript_38430:893-1702(+)